MARQARLIVPGQAHLVLQRGHLRTPLFDGEESAAAYLRQLMARSREHGVRVHAYGLFAHEVRLLMTPQTAAGLSALMKAVAMHHAQARNRADSAAGSPWQGRYASAVVDPTAWALDATLFVEGPSEGPDRPWAASADHHAGRAPVPWLVVHAGYWALGNTPFEREAAYRERQARGLPVDLAQIMRARVVNGWVLGAPAFLEEIGRLAARAVSPGRRGRPRKTVPI